METSMNRRNFLKAAIASGAVIAAGGALAGCASNNTAGSSTGAENVVGTAPVSIGWFSRFCYYWTSPTEGIGFGAQLWEAA